MDQNEKRYSFQSVDEAISKLKLDKRFKWFEFQGKLVKKPKNDKFGHKYPDVLIIDNQYIYIKTT